MIFGGPPLATLLGLFGAVGGALSALYLVRLRRRRVVVPFARLWATVARAAEATAPWRRWRRPWSLLLQLALLVLLVAALADPRPGGAAGARTLVIVVDASASMQARDGGARDGEATRLEAARREARRIVDGLGDGDLAALVRLDGAPALACGLTSDRRALAAAVDAIARAPSDAPGDLDGALRLAGDVVRGRRGPTVVLVGDGAWPREVLDRVRLHAPPATARADAGAAPPAAGALAGRGSPSARSPDATDGDLAAIDLAGVDLRFVPVGRSADNVGIVAFAARRHPTRRAGYDVLVEVRSARPAPSTVTLELLEEGDVVRREPIELAADGRARRVLSGLTGGGAHLEARLAGPRDLLAVDDRAFALLPPRPPQRVLLVTSGDLFLEGALLLDPDIVLDTVAPAAFDAARAAARYDALVLDGVTPPADVALPPAIYVDPRGPDSPFAALRDAPGVLITDVAERHPVMRFVSLTDVNASRSTRFRLRPGDVALASSVREPVIVARERPRKAVAIGFDLRRSDLPLRVAFPVLLANALDWLAPDVGRLEPAHRTGRVSRVAWPGAPPATVTLTDPTGARTRVALAGGRLPFAPSRVGFHRATATAGAGRGAVALELAASLADARETAIAPARALTVDGVALGGAPDARGSSRREPWAWLLVAAATLSLVEWWTYNRRITA